MATLSAVCWSLITPSFLGVDEPAHFAYAAHLAERRQLPTKDTSYSAAENTVLRGLQQGNVAFYPEHTAVYVGKGRLQLEEALSKPRSTAEPSGAGVASTEPPLYYALETIPYYMGLTANMLNRLELMRLLSAVMAGLTGFFTYMFLRELLPADPWAWTVGGLSASLAPLLGFTSGIVTPDALLFAVSSAIFYCLARAFRRGLTLRLGAMIGTLVAVGFLTKLIFIGLVPGIVLGLLFLGVRGTRREPVGSTHAFAVTALAILIAASPLAVYALRNLLVHRPLLGPLTYTLGRVAARGSLSSQITYAWDFYLPHLPGMAHRFAGVSTTRLWFNRTVGLYGWIDTSFPQWVDTLALIPAGLITILATRGIATKRSVLPSRLTELLTYLVMSAGLMALIATFAHIDTYVVAGIGYAQPRYLLSLLPLVAAGVALAARGAGRRWGPVVGALLVVLFLAHDIFSQLLVLARFYA